MSIAIAARRTGRARAAARRSKTSSEAFSHALGNAGAGLSSRSARPPRTNQPWALFAFIWNQQTRPVADGLLHAASIQSAGSAEGLASMLLADALYCLKLFEVPSATLRTE